MANSSKLTVTPSVDDGEQRAVQSTGATSEGLLWRYHHQREQVASNKKAQYQNQCFPFVCEILTIYRPNNMLNTVQICNSLFFMLFLIMFIRKSPRNLFQMYMNVINLQSQYILWIQHLYVLTKAPKCQTVFKDIFLSCFILPTQNPER